MLLACILGGRTSGLHKHYHEPDYTAAREAAHLGAQLLEPFHLALEIPQLDGKILPLDVPEFPKSLPQYVLNSRVYVRDEADTIYLAGLLRLGSERRAQCPKRQSTEERAPVHHSMS